jgi:hypothetical protein
MHNRSAPHAKGGATRKIRFTKNLFREELSVLKELEAR